MKNIVLISVLMMVGSLGAAASLHEGTMTVEVCGDAKDSITESHCERLENTLMAGTCRVQVLDLKKTSLVENRNQERVLLISRVGPLLSGIVGKDYKSQQDLQFLALKNLKDEADRELVGTEASLIRDFNGNPVSVTVENHGGFGGFLVSLRFRCDGLQPVKQY